MRRPITTYLRMYVCVYVCTVANVVCRPICTCTFMCADSACTSYAFTEIDVA